MTNSLSQEVKSGRIRRPVYDESPFMSFSITERKKAITVARGTKLKVVSGEQDADGDMIETTIQQVRMVDESQFVKLYTGQISALFELSKPAIKVFGLLMNEQQTRIGTDQVFLSFKIAQRMCIANGWPAITQVSYSRGIADLSDAKIIAACSNGAGWFFVNPAIVFNGDRARFITEFRKKPKSVGMDTKTQDMFKEIEF
jgi:hypothetical protein